MTNPGERLTRTWKIAVDRHPRKPNGDQLIYGADHSQCPRHKPTGRGVLDWYEKHPDAWEIVTVAPASPESEVRELREALRTIHEMTREPQPLSAGAVVTIESIARRALAPDPEGGTDG